MTVPDIVRQLVERFEQQYDIYRSARYNETQLRREFLDPFFEALGWDVFNHQGYAEMYKDVIHEDSLEIEGANKAPDYAFRIGGVRKFFVEAKKPAVNIENNIHPAYQLRRYAWSAKLPLGILTDFEEFAVYDCRAKPNQGDKASTGRVLLLNFRQYVEKWDEIAAVFSREAVLKGSFDQYAEGMKGKKGTAEVDDAFLAEIERWRDLLARNIALRNPSLSVRELNYAVQMTIDRIVFLRICEDRGVENDGQLKDIAANANVYPNLVQLFQRADLRYNSGLFHFKDEKGQSSAADGLTLHLKIDDKVLQDILRNLYYPESPYVFREIPADILGQVYERFLGKVIRLTAGHQAKVEEKPEVRKAGGVYYTPTYIVDYIVQNTVGKLLEGMTPKQAANLKILDPACGSGTFPLGAYQYLLDWHLKWYTEHDPEKWLTGKNPTLYQVKDGYRLTTAEKKRILLNNIHGVDIDLQAVEVTKLSLLLKVLEDETHETIGSQLSLLQERVLPDLGRNIQCGNSLIGPDYYEGQQLTMGGFTDEDERARINVFDWKAAFPQVFLQGGFDAVVGNPPYVRQESLSEFKEYFQKHYESYDGVADLYIYFIEKGIRLLRKDGLYSIIVSSSFLRATYGKGLRTFLNQNSTVLRLVDFGGLPIFENAKDTYVCIPLITPSKDNQQSIEVCRVPAIIDTGLQNFINENSYTVPSLQFSSEAWSLDNASKIELFQKIVNCGVSLKEYTKGQICYGIKTGLNEAFVIDTQTKAKLIAADPASAEIIKPLLQGEDIRRWHINYKNRWLIFTRRGINIDSYPAVKEYLMQWKEDLTPKQNKDQKKGRKPGRYKWYEIQDDVAYYAIFDSPKIVYPDIAKGPRFYFDKDGHYLANTAYAIGTSDLYLLGILNSKLFWFAISNLSIPFGIRAGEYRYRLIAQYMEKVPIRAIDFNDPADRAWHEQMVALVTHMLELTPLLSPQFQPTKLEGRKPPRTPQEKESLAREIESTDRRIDALVYELYGLNEDEIRIVEGDHA